MPSPLLRFPSTCRSASPVRRGRRVSWNAITSEGADAGWESSATGDPPIPRTRGETKAETRPDQIGTPAVPGQEWARFLREVARVLKPGGRFALLDSTVPRGDVGDLFNRFELMRDPSLPIAEWLALLAAAGLTVDAVESFTKRHGFASWAARSRVPEGDLPALAKLLLDADDEVSELFRVERDGETLSAFTDEKTLFLAIRPDS